MDAKFESTVAELAKRFPEESPLLKMTRFANADSSLCRACVYVWCQISVCVCASSCAWFCVCLWVSVCVCLVCGCVSRVIAGRSLPFVTLVMV